MSGLVDSLLILAQDGKNGGAPGGTTSFLLMLLPFIVIFFLAQLIFGSPQRREQRRKDELLKNLKKNDRVVTIGGIYGTVANIAAEKNEVTLKVDDNTRLKLRLDSIQSVLKDETEKEPAK